MLPICFPWCPQAVLQRLYYPYSMFMFLGWYDQDWWIGSEEEQLHLESTYKGCTVKARFEVVKYSLAPLSGYHTTDSFEVTDTGTVSPYVKYRSDLTKCMDGLMD